MGITPKDFAAMQQRLGGGPRPKGEALAPSAQSFCAYQTVLGIDPSVRGTGYGVIRLSKPHPVVLAQGTIKCPPKGERSRCLASIASTLREVLKTHRPEVCVMEGLFHAQNLQTALIMGEARGASIAVVAEAGLEIYEIAPRKMKLAVVGYGAAQKSAVAKMVQRMLHLAEPPAPDAADALGLALAFSMENHALGLNPPKRV